MSIVALALGAFALGLLGMVGVTLLDKRDPDVKKVKDPLEELVKSTQKSPALPASDIAPGSLTFPEVLTDHAAKTTALAVLRDERGRVEPKAQVEPDEDTAWVSKVASELPQAPRPTGDLLNATSVSREPKDALSSLAARASEAPPGEMAPMGNDGGVQLQVASVKDEKEADELVEALRKRGHQAFRVAVVLPGRGTWHRVRIGPFKSKYEADRYRRAFESTERMAPFIVDPEQVKRTEEVREAKRAARLAKQKGN